MAAPAFRAAGSGPTNTSTSVAIPKPSGTVEGDVLYALVTNGGAGTAPTTVPSGWALTVGLATGGGGWAGIYERVVGPSEPTSYTWSGFVDSCAGSMIAISGADTTTPTHKSSATANLDDSTPTGAGVTTEVPECLIVGGIGVGDNVSVSGWTATDPATLTERVEVQSSAGADTTAALAAATGAQSAVGPTGALNVTLAGSRNSIVFVLAVQPPQEGGGPATADATDTLTLADTASRAATSAARAAADVLTVADTAARTTSSSRTVADSMSLSDGAVAVVTRARAAADSLTVVDTATRATVGARAAVDTLVLADAAASTTGQHVTAADTVTLADAAARSVSLARAGDDRLIPGDGTNADLLDLDDAVARVTVAARAAVDALGVAEVAAATSGQMVSASDVLALDDAVDRAVTADRGAVDALALTDTAARATAGQRATVDGLALSDAASGATGQTVTAAETVSLTDSPGRVLALAGTAADALVLADAAGRTFTAERSVTDTLTLADAVAVSGGEPPAGRGTVTLTGYPAAALADRPDATVTSYGSEVRAL